MTGMFKLSAMSNVNMSNTLIGWRDYVNSNVGKLANKPSNVNLGIANVTLTPNGNTAVTDLEANPNNWTIT